MQQKELNEISLIKAKAQNAVAELSPEDVKYPFYLI